MSIYYKPVIVTEMEATKMIANNSNIFESTRTPDHTKIQLLDSETTKICAQNALLNQQLKLRSLPRERRDHGNQCSREKTSNRFGFKTMRFDWLR